MPSSSSPDRTTFRRAHSVLVVDDNPSMKYAVARHLRAGGYNTVEASGGAEALELSEFVSAVVLDVHLPDVDGFEVCRLLRARESTARLPVIHMSAVRMEEADALAAAESGGDGFLVAPVNPVELTTTLDRLLTREAGAGSGTARSGHAEDAQSPGARSGAGLRSILEQMTAGEKTRGR
ncbi:response regulator [Ramlibacter sp. AN1133]|uniref:response regulator n=1 Tax=Ramlibacter sp. AN1133 TaxID=3133429 RepID=UPI0030C65177